MKVSPCAGVLLLAFSATAFAQRPPVYPLRSQTAAMQSADNAYCYWQARQQTGVDMTHLSQRPPRTKRAPFTPDAGKGASEPPLPAARDASGDRSRGPSPVASRATPAPGGGAATGQSGDGASSSAGSEKVLAASGSAAAGSSPVAGSPGAASAGSAEALPRLPPPPPPMTAYWQAYGDCMHERGYGVQ